MLIFETERLSVRQYTFADADHFFALNGDEEVTRYIRPAKSREECDAFLLQNINSYSGDTRFGRWAAEHRITRRFIGSFALIPVEGREQMQIGYALLPSEWGKGYATELSRKGLHYVFTQTEIDPVYAYANAANLASHHVLLKAGMHPDGSYEEGGKTIAGFRLGKEEWLSVYENRMLMQQTAGPGRR